VSPTASLIANLKVFLAAANPGLATKDDLARLEERLDELAELVRALSQRLGQAKPGGDGA
jgi:hypothetical protein